MWKPFHCNDHLYLIKYEKSDQFKVYLNDLQSIFSQVLSEADILQSFQQYNPLLDVKLEEAVDHFSELINNIDDKTQIEVTTSNENIQLILKSVDSMIEITFELNLKKQTEDEFMKQMTVPLIQTIKYLEDQQKALSTLLEKKDRELEEYKLQFDEIFRSDLKTEKFDRSEIFNNDGSMMLNVFTNQNFWSKFVEQHGDKTAPVLEVKSEPWNNVKRKRKVYSAKDSRKKNAGIKFSSTPKP